MLVITLRLIQNLNPNVKSNLNILLKYINILNLNLTYTILLN
jgi:hypothetical protein